MTSARLTGARVRLPALRLRRDVDGDETDQIARPTATNGWLRAERFILSEPSCVTRCQCRPASPPASPSCRGSKKWFVRGTPATRAISARTAAADQKDGSAVHVWSAPDRVEARTASPVGTYGGADNFDLRLSGPRLRFPRHDLHARLRAAIPNAVSADVGATASTTTYCMPPSASRFSRRAQKNGEVVLAEGTTCIEPGRSDLARVSPASASSSSSARQLIAVL